MAVMLLAVSVLLGVLTASASAMPAPFDRPAPVASTPRQIPVAHHSGAPTRHAGRAAVQHIPVRHTAVQHILVRHTAVRHATVRHTTARHAAARHAAVRHATVRHTTVRHATVRHTTARHAAARHATAVTATAPALARPDARQAALLAENTTYPPRQTCTATSSSVAATESSSGRASISGSGFDPSSTVRVVTGATTLGSITSDQAGGFVVAVSAPATARLVATSATCSAAVTPGRRTGSSAPGSTASSSGGAGSGGGNATPNATPAPTDSPLAQGQLSISLPSTFFVLLVALAIVLAAVTLCVIAIRSGRRIQP